MPEPCPNLINIAAVQMRSSFDVAQNRDFICEQLGRLSAEGCQIALFPECALTGYDFQKGFTHDQGAVGVALTRIQAVCREKSICAVIGTAWTEDGLSYVAAPAINERGEIVDIYKKVQLAGEQWACPGDHLSVCHLAQVPCSIIICHDSRYPELVRLPVLAGARLVLYISHESPVREEFKLEPYRAQVVARAVENGVWVAQCNAPANPDASGSHGQSRIVDPAGQIIKEASIFNAETISATIDMAPATAAFALRSPSCTFLREWWEAGVKLVEVKP